MEKEKEQPRINPDQNPGGPTRKIPREIPNIPEEMPDMGEERQGEMHKEQDIVYPENNNRDVDSGNVAAKPVKVQGFHKQ